MKVLSSILSCALLVGLTTGLPNGAPAIACKNMAPQHGADAQNLPSPYSITFSKEGTGYNVALEAFAGDSFKGFLLQAREPGTNNILGAFTFSGSDVQTLDCSGGTNNAVTHTSNSEKTKIEVTWEPSPDFNGEVAFVVSTVRSKLVFWVKEESDAIFIEGKSNIVTNHHNHALYMNE